MLQKAYDQAKEFMVHYNQRTNIQHYALKLEVRTAMYKMMNSLTSKQINKMLKGELTLSDLEQFKAPDCSIKQI